MDILEQQDQKCKGCKHRMEDHIEGFPFSSYCYTCSRNLLNQPQDYFEQIPTFKVNEYITLKLLEKQTIIFVDNDHFSNCKYLLFTLDKKNLENYDEINSIDEAAELLDNSGERSYEKRNSITPLEEFWGHCSNLQVWAEHGYDTRLLHSNLAFPLLKKLVDVGDPKAKKVFKNEIALRISDGNLSVITYLHHQGYLAYLTEEELQTIARDLEDPFLNFIFKYHVILKVLGANVNLTLKNINLPREGMICFREALTFEEISKSRKEAAECHPLSSIVKSKDVFSIPLRFGMGNKENYNAMDFGITFDDSRFLLKYSALELILNFFNDVENWILAIPHKKGENYSLLNSKKRIWFMVQNLAINESYFQDYLNKKNRLLKQAQLRAKKYNFNYKITIPRRDEGNEDV